jgi:hypothetical protein
MTLHRFEERFRSITTCRLGGGRYLIPTDTVGRTVYHEVKLFLCGCVKEDPRLRRSLLLLTELFCVWEEDGFTTVTCPYRSKSIMPTKRPQPVRRSDCLSHKMKISKIKPAYTIARGFPV